jgi:hypothetical protein
LYKKYSRGVTIMLTPKLQAFFGLQRSPNYDVLLKSFFDIKRKQKEL